MTADLLAVKDLLTRLLSLVVLTWLTYSDATQGTFLIDDQEGIAGYDGKPQWKLKRDNKNYAPCNFHTILRWIRYHAGKVCNPDQDWKKKNKSAYIPSSRAHHRFNIYLASGCTVLLYLFLSKIFDPNVVYLAVALFIVHPLGCQVVAWMSGIGYTLSFFFMLTGLNLALMTHGWFSSIPGTVASVALVGIFQFLSIQAQFAQMGIAVIYLYLGMWPHAIMTTLLAFTVCRPILQDAVVIRVKTFQDQQMGASTKFHLRKFLVAAKTLFYYTRMAFFPKRLGLYHTFGYHYSEPYIESEDKYLYLGLLTLATWLVAFFLGSPIMKFCVLWYLSILFLFLNWITIHQFVSERYNWIPSFGICLMVSWFLYSNHLVWVWCILFGIAIMRTWAHIPTFYNELQFYESNVWNHPTSEVAIGNLGVAYAKVGLPGSAHDRWMIGTRINPEYDVNWYNLYSIFKGNNQVEAACQALSKSLSCRTCHFPTDWVEEMKFISSELDRMKRPPNGFSVPFRIGVRS